MICCLCGCWSGLLIDCGCRLFVFCVMYLFGGLVWISVGFVCVGETVGVSLDGL